MDHWNQAGAALSRLHAQLRVLFGWRHRSKRRFFPETVSHYELLNEIGAGARGIVYRARDRRSHQLVALKLLRWHVGQESRRRFLREAACASAVAHPYIVRTFEIIQDEEWLGIVMEYVPGMTLSRAIPARGLPLKTFCRYALQIAGAVAAIHSAKIIHRDLKPANFVVMRDGGIKLLDFGLAKVISPRCRTIRNPRLNLPNTRDGTIQGTPDYMSPEQVQGHATDQRSDVFSLGSLFYAMLTGRPPFHGDSEIETMHAVLRKAPPKLPARIPPPVRDVVRRCLAKNPEARYDSATEVWKDLVRVVQSLYR